MSVRTEDMRRQRLNDVLVILAVLGVFAAFDVIGHKDIRYYWASLLGLVTFSAICLFLTRDRQAVDTFSAVMAALFTLYAVAMTAGDRTHPNWWPFFLAFAIAAILFTSLTRKKGATLIAIAAIVGFRLLVFVIVYALRR
jgi:hypothetical protein